MMFALCTIAVVLTLIYVFIYLRKEAERTIPGLEPKDHQNGNFTDMAAAGSLHTFLTKLHNDYGSIASFWFGPKYHVSVASAESFKALRGVRGRPRELFELFKPLFGAESITYVNGETHKIRRAATDHAFGTEEMAHHCEVFNKVAIEMLAKLSSLPPDDHIPTTQYTLSLSIKGIAQAAFGAYFEDDATCLKLQHYYDICWHEMGLRMVGDMPEEGSERTQKFEQALKTMKDMIREIVQARKNHPPPPQERKFVDILIENEDLYPEETLFQESLTYIIAAFHTSGYLMAWILYFLAKNPDVERKLHEEIVSIIGDKESVSPNDVSEMEYMKRVINESLRLSVLAPWGGKILDEDIVLEGYLIKSGTPIVTPFGVLHEDETIWPENSKFDPERFSPENIRKRDNHQHIFQPFGLPRRICPGYRFAYYEVTVFMAMLLRQFKWSLVPGQVINRDYGFVTYPDKEIWMQIESRV